MEKFIEGILIAIVAIILLGFVAVIGGTIVFWIWPHVIPDVFPALVAGGFVVAKIAWWKAVLLTWLTAILFKSSSANAKSN